MAGVGQVLHVAKDAGAVHSTRLLTKAKDAARPEAISLITPRSVQVASLLVLEAVALVVALNVHIQDAEVQEANLNVSFADAEADATVQNVVVLRRLNPMGAVSVTSHVD